MCFLFTFILVLLKENILVDLIQINYIQVPTAVQNNSGRPAILDCNYSVRPDDSDLVIKWYLNDELVYQWIPPQKPQCFGTLKDRLDLQYRATDDPKTAYRAMKINNPTNEIAGEYKCFVSTFTDEDFSMKNMIVFEPEKYIVVVKGRETENTINFTCFASETYPAPKLTLYKDIRNDFYTKIRLRTVQWDIKKHANGRYSVFIVTTTTLSTLNPGTLIHCELRIPGTSYVKIKSLLYYPNMSQENNGTFSCQGVKQTLLVVIIFTGTFILLIHNFMRLL